MATTVCWFLSGVLLCFLLGRGTQGFTQDGPKTRQIVQELLPKQSGPYESAFTHARANFTKVEPLTGDQDSYLNNEDGPPKERVTLPPLNCVSDIDCNKYEDPFLLCRGAQCICRPPSCWVYYYEVTSAWTARNVFTCGTCGVLGSWCNATLECDFPGVCWSDGFCHCPRGENEDGICLTTNTSWIYKLSLLGMGVIGLFAFIIVSYSCYKEQPWRNPDSCWFSCCTKNGKKQRRRGSCEKTPAFTVQNNYASQDFTQFSSTEEPFGNQESGISGAVPRRSSPSHTRLSSESSGENEVNTSITSVATTATIISENSVEVHDSPSPSTSSTHAGIASFPAPSTSGSAHNSSASTSVTTYQDVTRIVPKDVTTTLQAVPEAKTCHGGVGSSAGSQNCDHERCNLCLPRGPATRPASQGDSQTSTPTHTRSTSYFSRRQDHEEDSIKFTVL